MALGDIFGGLLDRLFQAVKNALGPFGRLWDLVSKFYHGFTDAFQTGKDLADEIISEINEWRNFKENINVKNRVISIPKAIDQTQALIDSIVQAWHSIVDLARQLKGQVEQGTGGDPAADAEEAMQELEAGGLRHFLTKFPKLARGLEKILGFLALIVGALESIVAAINDLKQIVDTIKGIREEIETGNTIFLKSNNPRRTVHLDDGTSMKIRVGNLHS